MMSISTKSNGTQIKWGAIISYLIIGVEIIISLVFTPWMIGVLGKSNYAVYTIVYSLIALFLFDFGISMSATKFLSKYRAEQNEKMVNNLLSMFFKLYLIVDLVIFIVLFTIYFFINNMYVGLTPEAIQKLKQCFIIVGIYSLISFPCLNLDALFSAYEKFIPLKLCLLFQKVVTTALMFVMLLKGGDVLLLIIINAAVSLVVILVKFILAYKLMNFRFSFKFFDTRLLKTLLLFSIWIAVISLRDKLINGLTPTVLGIMSNESEVSFYGYGFTLITYAYSFSTAIGALFLYKVTKILSSKNSQRKLFSLMVKIGKIQLFIIALIFCGFIVFGREFLSLFIGEEYIGSYFVTIFLLIPFLFSVTKQIALTSSYVTENVKMIAIFNIVTAIICVGVSFPFAKLYGALGVSICYCACCLLCELLCDIFVYARKMHINMLKFYARTIFRILPTSIILVIAGLLLTNKVVAIDSKLKLLIGACAFGVAYVLIHFFTFLSRKERRIVLRRKTVLYKNKLQKHDSDKINIVWVTQRFDQSVAPVCDKLYSNSSCNLKVVLFDTDKLGEDKYRVGYERDYVKDACVAEEKEIDEIFTNSDAIIIGQANIKKIKKYMKMGKLVFRVSESPYKNGREFYRLPLDYFRYLKRHYIYQKYNMFYLAIGYDCYDDLIRFDDYYEQRSFVWGYYPLSENQLKAFDEKRHSSLSILWSGKLMELKHPTDAVYAAKFLQDNGYDCKVTIIGSGDEAKKIEEQISKYQLQDNVTLVGPISHDELQNKMRESSVYLFSSDSREGWGMVLNEGLANGCACLASSTSGAGAVLINDNQNGLLYKNRNEFEQKLLLLTDEKTRVELGRKASSSYSELYTTEVVTNRLIELIKTIQNNTFASPYSDGPCSNCESLQER